MSDFLHPLTRWLDLEGSPERAEFCRRIGVSRMALRRYEKDRMPKQPILDTIVKETGGAVTANAWLGREAADVVSQRQQDA